MRKIISLLFILLSNAAFASFVTSSDPYQNVVYVTNTTAWPYQADNFGTASFEFGHAIDGNEDAIILDQLMQRGFQFPSSFSFGVACSAYQYEGNRIAPTLKNLSGIGWSMWDVFSKKGSWLNPKGTNIASVDPTGKYTVPSGEFAIQGFYPEFYQQDLQLAQNLGVEYYRLSISWPRLFPHPNMKEPDPAGIKYYQSVLADLKQRNIKVLITLYHWDLPAWLYNFGDKRALNKTYGWLDMREAKDNLVLKEFQKYVAAAYQAFGPYSPYFSTFNEPLTFTNSAFTDGVHAPGQYGFVLLSKKNKSLYGANLNENLERIPYLQAINIIKAHYIAYKTIHHLYDTDKTHRYPAPPEVNIVLNSDWAEPYRIECDKEGKNCHYNEQDKIASQNNMDYMLGWWLDPVMFGTWPQTMNSIYSKEGRLSNVGIDDRDHSCLREDGMPIECPVKGEKLTLADYIRAGGALDSLAINHYTGYFAVDMTYAKSNYNTQRAPGAVPPDQYQHSPYDLKKGWYSDQNAFITQFRYYKYLTPEKLMGPAPIDSNRIYVIGNSGNKPWLRQTWFAYRKLLQYINLYYLQNSEQNNHKHPHSPIHTKSNINFSDLAIYLTENGTSVYQESQQNSLEDLNRIQYLVGNLGAVEQAVNFDHINVKLYTYWSIADNFEWSEGYDSRFGIVWIDYANQYARKAKQSYYCYQAIIKNKTTGIFPENCRWLKPIKNNQLN